MAIYDGDRIGAGSEIGGLHGPGAYHLVVVRRPALDGLAAEIITCRRCPRLVAEREKVAATRVRRHVDEEYWGRPVTGYGDHEARLLIVGLAPGAHGANRTGRVFTGDLAGDWLFRALHRAGFANQPTSVRRDDGLVLTGAYVSNTVRCVPPGNDPKPPEEHACSSYLTREIEELRQLRVIVTLGKEATRSVAKVLDLRPRPKFSHSLEVALPGGRTLLCCYHTSQQNTNTGRLTEEMLDAVFARAVVLVALGPH